MVTGKRYKIRIGPSWTAFYDDHRHEWNSRFRYSPIQSITVPNHQARPPAPTPTVYDSTERPGELEELFSADS